MNPLQASMPMYDFPEVAPALDHWWQGITQHLKAAGFSSAPESLLHGHPVHQLWDDKHLLLSQCCGYDLVHSYTGKLTALVTPVL